MSVSGGFDVFKSFKEWRDEYRKNYDKDLYIHRLEDLLEKAEAENKRLKKEIEELKDSEPIPICVIPRR